jgi:hypothetical protein
VSLILGNTDSGFSTLALIDVLLIPIHSLMTLGADRDKPQLKTIPEEHEKRRSVFWELLNMDCRMVGSLPCFVALR